MENRVKCPQLIRFADDEYEFATVTTVEEERVPPSSPPPSFSATVEAVGNFSAITTRIRLSSCDINLVKFGRGLSGTSNFSLKFDIFPWRPLFRFGEKHTVLMRPCL